MEKKYQVFVSSTYEDLKEERKAVTTALLESNCIPAGMELFPASNQSSWSIIQKVIDESDYYLLILAGRYGSFPRTKSSKKIGYTEMEFDYASKIGKPIIAFIHDNRNSISAGNVEETRAGKKRLDDFINKVKSSGRNVSFWHNQLTLISGVKTAIASLIKDTPSGGWIKGSQIEELPRYQNLLSAGMSSAYYTIDNIDFNSLIRKTQKEIDIVHIHGMTWTNSNRSTLVEKLRSSDLTFRVVLLDVGGIFFQPYAEFIGKDADFLFNKTKEVLEIWKDMYDIATSHGKADGAKVNFYFHNGVPSKSLYRFDNTILSIPVTMTCEKTALMPTFVCDNTGSNSIYSSYLSEMEVLIADSQYSFSMDQYIKGLNPISDLEWRFAALS